MTNNEYERLKAQNVKLKNSILLDSFKKCDRLMAELFQLKEEEKAAARIYDEGIAFVNDKNNNDILAKVEYLKMAPTFSKKLLNTGLKIINIERKLENEHRYIQKMNGLTSNDLEY